MARPTKKLPNGTDKYNIENMCKKIDEYINKNKNGVPILKECCLLNDWPYDYVMQLQRENPLLAQSTKKLLSWKEVNLEKFALTGKVEKTMAIFSLKQLGWKDKQDNDENEDMLKKLTELLGNIKGVI